MGISPLFLSGWCCSQFMSVYVEHTKHQQHQLYRTPDLDTQAIMSPLNWNKKYVAGVALSSCGTHKASATPIVPYTRFGYASNNNSF
jgi:hypothetical protein